MSATKITVNNSTETTIQVSINKWQDQGQTGKFPIQPGGKDSWEREDEYNRGFVMFVSESISSISGPYYVLAGADVHFYSDGTVTGATKIRG